MVIIVNCFNLFFFSFVFFKIMIFYSFLFVVLMIFFELILVDLINLVFYNEWDVVLMKVQRNVLYYQCCLDLYLDIIFFFEIKWKFLFYIMSILFFCILMVFVVVFGFVFFLEFGEKVFFEVMVLFFFVVFLLMVIE